MSFSKTSYGLEMKSVLFDQAMLATIGIPFNVQSEMGREVMTIDNNMIVKIVDTTVQNIIDTDDTCIINTSNVNIITTAYKKKSDRDTLFTEPLSHQD